MISQGRLFTSVKPSSALTCFGDVDGFLRSLFSKLTMKRALYLLPLLLAGALADDEESTESKARRARTRPRCACVPLSALT